MCVCYSCPVSACALQAQLVVLAAQIAWSSGIEASLQSNKPAEGLNANLAVTTATLTVLADSVLHEQPPLRRRKLEHLVRLAMGLVFPPILVLVSVALSFVRHELEKNSISL